MLKKIWIESMQLRNILLIVNKTEESINGRLLISIYHEAIDFVTLQFFRLQVVLL